MTLTGEAEEAVLKMEINELTEWCWKFDRSAQTYETYEMFEKFGKPYNMIIADDVYDYNFLDGVHKYRLLNSTNLSRGQQQLVKATVSKMSCNIIKDQLKKGFH